VIRRATAAHTALALLLVVTAPACRGGGAPGAPVAVPRVAVDGVGGTPTDRRIAATQAKLDATPNDDTARLALASQLLQKARETADPSLYERAGTLLDDLTKRRPSDAAVLVASGTLALARHDFRRALNLGTKALALAPGFNSAYAVLIDANNELGRYDVAVTLTQAMADAKPDLAALARVSYVRELRGDLDGAITAMGQAVTAGQAPGGGENLAYAQVLLGQLLLTTGRLDAAERAFADAETAFRGFPAAAIGRARLLVARGDLPGAAGLYADVVRRAPLAEYVIEQAEVARAMGDTTGANEATGLVNAIAKVYRANGVNVDLELAVFSADEKPGKDAVARARRALKDRPGIQAHDGLAWNLFKVGKLDEAAAEADAALALGWKDPRARYHAAAIADARGRADEARTHLQVVLATNPRFSASLAPVVADLAGRLGLDRPA